MSDTLQVLGFSAVVFGGYCAVLALLDLIQGKFKEKPFVYPTTGQPWSEPKRSPSPPPPRPIRTSPPPNPPIDSNAVQDLTKLRDSCLSLFDKKPIKFPPPVYIETDLHFSVIIPDPNFKRNLPLAHYEPSKNIICVRETYLKTARPESLVDTMKHELLHAWIHQHDFKGDRAHDDLFKTAAELLGIEWRESYRAT